MKTITFNELMRESLDTFFKIKPKMVGSKIYQFSESFIQDNKEFLLSLVNKEINYLDFIPQSNGDVYSINGVVYHYKRVGKYINVSIGWIPMGTEVYSFLDVLYTTDHPKSYVFIHGGTIINGKEVLLKKEYEHEGVGIINSILFGFLTFMKLSDDKIKFLTFKPNERKGSKKFGNLIYNNSGYHITHIKSDWNVTKIYGGVTKVRGHFRLQPCGKGKSDIKLIFIEEHVKTVYIKKSVKSEIIK